MRIRRRAKTFAEARKILDAAETLELTVERIEATGVWYTDSGHTVWLTASGSRLQADDLRSARKRIPAMVDGDRIHIRPEDPTDYDREPSEAAITFDLRS